MAEALTPAALQDTGLFDAAAAGGLARRARAGKVSGFRENQALVAILSTDLWHRAFCRTRADIAPLPIDRADVCLTGGTEAVFTAGGVVT